MLLWESLRFYLKIPEVESMWYSSGILSGEWYLCFDLTSDRRVREFWTESQALLSKTGKAFMSSRDVHFPEITLSLCVWSTSKVILFLWLESLTPWGLPQGKRDGFHYCSLVMAEACSHEHLEAEDMGVRPALLLSQQASSPSLPGHLPPAGNASLMNHRRCGYSWKCLLIRGGRVTIKLMKLGLQGSSLAQTPLYPRS